MKTPPRAIPKSLAGGIRPAGRSVPTPALYDDKLLFRDTGVVFTLKGDILSMITDYDFIKPESPDAKQFISFLDQMYFYINATGKIKRERNLKRNYYNKRAIFACGLKTLSLSQNPNELCNRLKLLLLNQPEIIRL